MGVARESSIDIFVPEFSDLPLSIDVRSVVEMEEDVEGYWRRTIEISLMR